MTNSICRHALPDDCTETVQTTEGMLIDVYNCQLCGKRFEVPRFVPQKSRVVLTLIADNDWMVSAIDHLLARVARMNELLADLAGDHD